MQKFSYKILPPTVPLYTYRANSILFSLKSGTAFMNPLFLVTLRAEYQGKNLYNVTKQFTTTNVSDTVYLCDFADDSLNTPSSTIISYYFYIEVYDRSVFLYQAEFVTEVPQSSLVQLVGEMIVRIGGAFINKDIIEITLQFLSFKNPTPPPIIVHNGLILQAHDKIYSRLGFRHGR